MSGLWRTPLLLTRGTISPSPFTCQLLRFSKIARTSFGLDSVNRKTQKEQSWTTVKVCSFPFEQIQHPKNYKRQISSLHSWQHSDPGHIDPLFLFCDSFKFKATGKIGMGWTGKWKGQIVGHGSLPFICIQ